MELYWWFRLSQLHDLAQFIAVFSFIGMTMALVVSTTGSKYTRTMEKAIRVLLSVFLVAMLMTSVIPSKAELAVILGWEAMNAHTRCECPKSEIKD